MYSRMRRFLSRRIWLKIIVWYVLVFGSCSVLLFFLVVHELTDSITQNDRQFITEKIVKYQAADRIGGRNLLGEALRSDAERNRAQNFLVVVMRADGSIRYESLPRDADWVDLDILRMDVDSERWRWLEHTLSPAVKRDYGAFRLQARGRLLETGETLWVGRLRGNRLIVGWLGDRMLDVLGPGILVAFLGGLLIARQARKPLRALLATVRDVEQGNMTARVPETCGVHELNELAGLMNRMLDRIERLVVGMKEALDNVAHDMRTPLARMRIQIESVVSSEQDGDAYREALFDCAEEVGRLDRMLSTLMDISEAETGTMELRHEAFSLVDGLQGVMEVQTFVAEEKGVSLVSDVDEAVTVWADRARLGQLLCNLVGNAIKYTEAGGTVRILARECLVGVAIRVVDTGCGIPEEDVPKIFDRLYRADKSRSEKGLGLGLSLVRAIATAHHGRVCVERTDTEGSAFLVELPPKPARQKGEAYHRLEGADGRGNGISD